MKIALLGVSMSFVLSLIMQPAGSLSVGPSIIVSNIANIEGSQ
jgi:hypothetical protein